MKRYDLSKVMKGAHNMYRTGKYASFSAALKRRGQRIFLVGNLSFKRIA